jgi:hypothetical protein
MISVAVRGETAALSDLSAYTLIRTLWDLMRFERKSEK